MNKNLTLTSVVFECTFRHICNSKSCNLTLTSVVFEFVGGVFFNEALAKFNFNKCCI